MRCVCALFFLLLLGCSDNGPNTNGPHPAPLIDVGVTHDASPDEDVGANDDVTPQRDVNHGDAGADIVLGAAVGEFCARLGSSMAERNAECLGGGIDFWRERPNVACTCDTLSRLAAEGSVRLDRAQGEACLAAMATTSCDKTDSLLQWDGPCWAAVVGQKPRGASCTVGLYEECSADTYCRRSTPSDNQGTCAARTPVGAPCDGSQCTAGYRCDCPTPDINRQGCNGPRVCVAYPPLGLGETCSSEFHEYDCGADLECIQSTMWHATCRTTVPGRSCASESDCRADERCNGSACVPNTDGVCETTAGRRCAAGHGCFAGRCEPLRGIGQPCTRSDQCGEGAQCGADGRCQARPMVGEACTRGQTPECVLSYCHTPGQARAGTCRTYLGEGEACGWPGASGTECGPYASCSAATQTCVRECL